MSKLQARKPLGLACPSVGKYAAAPARLDERDNSPPYVSMQLMAEDTGSQPGLGCSIAPKTSLKNEHLREVGYQWLDANEFCDPGGVKKSVTMQPEESDVELVPAGKINWSEQDIMELLKKEGLSKDNFEVGSDGKGFDSFVQECVRGECSIHRRGAGGKISLVRAVNVVVIVIFDVRRNLVLFEVRQQMADGRERKVEQMPGAKARPAEDFEDVVTRYLERKLPFPVGVLRIETGRISYSHEESSGASRNYPSVPTVYRKFTINGCVDWYSIELEVELSEKELNAWGFSKDSNAVVGAAGFSTTDKSTKDVHFWEWRDIWTVSKQINLQLPLQAGPDGWRTALIRQYLSRNHSTIALDSAEFPEAHSEYYFYLESLKSELEKSLCVLKMTPEGKVLRQVDVVSVYITREANQQILVRETASDNRLPEIVKTLDEEPWKAAGRLLFDELGLDSCQTEMPSSGNRWKWSVEMKVLESNHLAGFSVPDCPVLATVVRQAIIYAQVS